jgi:TRAP-type uncharacterized transport system fused permease subunit
VAFLIPLIFIYNPALLLNGTLVEIISLVLVLLIAVVFLSAALTGYFFTILSLFQRTIMAAAAIGAFVFCAHPDLVGRPVTLAAATLAIVGFFVWLFLRSRATDPVTDNT